MTTTQVLFSIIIPAYNRAEFISTAIESVIQQDHPNWELIIIDDGSTDNTKEVVSSFQDERIVYIYQENQERSIARNNGIKIAKGSYICFLDSDDVYLRHHLSTLYKYIIKLNFPVAFLYTHAVKKIQNKWFLGTSPNPNKTPIQSAIEDFFYPTSSCFNKSILSKHSFPESFYMCEDTHLFIRVLINHDFIPVYETTTLKVEHIGTSTHKRQSSVPKMLNTLECLMDLSNNHLKNRISDKKRINKFIINVLMYYSFLLINTSNFTALSKLYSQAIKIQGFKRVLGSSPLIIIKGISRELLILSKIYQPKGLPCLEKEKIQLFQSLCPPSMPKNI